MPATRTSSDVPATGSRSTVTWAGAPGASRSDPVSTTIRESGSWKRGACVGSSIERLAVTATSRGRWRGQPVVVRAGWLIDAAFTAELSGLMGLELALRDEKAVEWIAVNQRQRTRPQGVG